MAAKKEKTPRIVREVAAILWLGGALLTILSLVSYDPKDLALLTTHPNEAPTNFIGILGAYASMLLIMAFGIGSYLVPALFFVAGLAMLVHDHFVWRWKLLWTGVFLATSACLLHLQGWLNEWTEGVNGISPGGFVGQWLDDYILVAAVGPVGAKIVLWMLYIASVIFLFELHPRAAWTTLRNWWKEWQEKRRQARIGEDPVAQKLAERDELEKQKRELEKQLAKMTKGKIPVPEPEPALAGGAPAFDSTATPPEVIDASRPQKSKTKKKTSAEKSLSSIGSASPAPPESTPSTQVPASPDTNGKGNPKRTPRSRNKQASVRHAGEPGQDLAPSFTDYELPSLHHLHENTASGETGMNEAELRSNSQLLVRTLADFGIATSPGPITKGATITRYEVIPHTGVRVDKIKNLKRDIARVMKAEKVNILAPIPGKDSVGVEVANSKKVPIVLRDLLESEAWTQNKAKIPIALGKDVYGHTLIADLAEMPHLLIAGTTGSGKSVCINALVMSLMYKFKPDELRLILVDPKQVEMQIYNTIPHLVVPVVTEAKKVLTALRWVIQEMEQRYRILAKVGVRNITSFNRRPPKTESPPEEAQPDGDAQMELGETPNGSGIQVPREDDLHIPDRLPYIVVIIDELADLMQTAPADVEASIARLTAKARAAGIHLVVATQTPRREVITGVIKTNIPSRVAFQVPSALDSRVILDENGAENLLGKGDLLYLPPGSSKIVRGQGAFVGDDEVTAVVDFCSSQAEPEFDQGIQKKMSGDNKAIDDVSEDDLELLQKCLEICRQEKKASTSMLQRRLRLGYNRAAWIMDKFQELGIISPPDPDNPARPREFLVDIETYELPGS